MTTRSLLLLALMTLVLPRLTYSWTASRRTFVTTKPSFLLFSSASRNEDQLPQTTTLDSKDPCWQTFLDDDCSMSNIYSANFVASKWIQSMPCGHGIEVRFEFMESTV
jgi:hypothetical protein